MMSTLEVSDDDKKSSDEVYGDFIDTVKVEGKPVLRHCSDEGCTEEGVRKTRTLHRKICLV